MTPQNPLDPDAATLHALIESRLAALAAYGGDTYGPAGELPGRLLAVAPIAAGAWRLELASDGLDLSRKAALERDLTATVADANIAPGALTVYFKRRHAGTQPAPAPLAAKAAAPFGLKYDKRAIPGVREVLVVASGKGGVGKSTVSVNLAVALAQAGSRVGLLDADIYGPSAPLMLGLKGPLEVVGPDRIAPLTGHGVKCVSFGFLTDTREPVIWRGPMVAKAVKQLCYNVEWGALDYLVVDLPPGTGDVQMTLIESLPIHGAVIVTTPQDVALLDAHKALSMFERLEVPVVGLVENMAYYHCPRCGHGESVFGAGGAERMSLDRRIPILARLPLAAAVRARSDAGRPIALEKATSEGAPFHALARLIRDRGQRI
jgi:ATP-binding protein involved in chromosome partitioning